MITGIQLFVGLGNPGKKYIDTRHNAGVWFLDLLAQNLGISFEKQNKFQSQLATYDELLHKIYLLIPTTFMNLTGNAVASFSRYYKLSPEKILIAHDDIDLPIGTVRLKFGGGHGGHNGLRNIISQLGTNKFHRLRIGVGHPGHKDDVTNYVLTKPTKLEKDKINTSISQAEDLFPELIKGNFQQATQKLHT